MRAHGGHERHRVEVAHAHGRARDQRERNIAGLGTHMRGSPTGALTRTGAFDSLGNGVLHKGDLGLGGSSGHGLGRAPPLHGVLLGGRHYMRPSSPVMWPTRCSGSLTSTPS